MFLFFCANKLEQATHLFFTGPGSQWLRTSHVWCSWFWGRTAIKQKNDWLHAERIFCDCMMWIPWSSLWCCYPTQHRAVFVLCFASVKLLPMQCYLPVNDMIKGVASVCKSVSARPRLLAMVSWNANLNLCQYWLRVTRVTRGCCQHATRPQVRESSARFSAHADSSICIYIYILERFWYAQNQIWRDHILSMFPKVDLHVFLWNI